ncbi:MAG: hypothetical protein CL533_18365 [Afipia sp.]|jgi:hypothetical protein|uniref:Uncharacterized protein n=1 Tax=Afipia massiliensis TaxID=211460 RepID=A0A840N0A0_9BRAD|nr:hypothetical protein [Afipia massiliensis]MAH71184.1 hypothetical protein [Afipia sp.]MBB5053655.1 hypothetical protein [Afipia massiliensis]OUX59708.1 MAG: hypothetical protein CBB64_18320 [Afipia sp. TMED4]HCX16611.1 hypothetical protein [Afipia sp.]
MRRLRIFTKHLTSEEIAALSALAAASGFAADEIETVLEIGAPLVDCDDEVILIPISAAACAAPDLEDDVKQVSNGARRAICVWPEDAEAEVEVPASARKYAYSIVPWNAEKLQAAAADDDVLIFEMPSGDVMPKVYTERNLCVDEEAQPK